MYKINFQRRVLINDVGEYLGSFQEDLVRVQLQFGLLQRDFLPLHCHVLVYEKSPNLRKEMRCCRKNVFNKSKRILRKNITVLAVV